MPNIDHFTERSETSYTLAELLNVLKTHIDQRFGSRRLWVQGELSEFKQNPKSGHYYGELVEYGQTNSKQTRAKIRVMLWRQKAPFVLNKFYQTTGEKLQPSMKVLLEVQVHYHINYGLSLHIADIDPGFTLGDRESRKKKILQTLQKQQIIDNNRQLNLPADYTQLAVISSESAAGLGDFVALTHELEKAGLCHISFYQAVMQGEDCCDSIVKALHQIEYDRQYDQYDFDAIIIVRGGGSQADLDAFNHLTIAQTICQCSLPVYIGIGHQRDETILDHIASKRFDTPSKVASHLYHVITRQALNAYNDFAHISAFTEKLVKQHRQQSDALIDLIHTQARQIIQMNRQSCNHLDQAIHRQSSQINQIAYQALQQTFSALQQTARYMLNEKKEQIANQFQKIKQNGHAYLHNQKVQLQHLQNRAIQNGIYVIRTGQHQLQPLKEQIDTKACYELKKARQMIDHHYQTILSMAVEPTLKRGFALTQDTKGRYITTAEKAYKHNELTITYQDGTVPVEIKHERTK